MLASTIAHWNSMNETKDDDKRGREEFLNAHWNSMNETKDDDKRGREEFLNALEQHE